MEIRRATYTAAIRVAVAVSTVAAVVALALDALGEVSRPSLVMSVMIVGFVTSWIQTGRAADDARRPSHRLVTVPIRRPLV